MKKPQRFVTPAGTFQYPRLNEPHAFQDGDRPRYSVNLILPAATAANLIAELQPLYDEAIAEKQAEYQELPVRTRKQHEFKANPFFHPVYDEQTEEETGDILFKFKAFADGTSKSGKSWTFVPPVFDSHGARLTNVPSIWSGSVGKIAFKVHNYFNAKNGAGISLYLEAVQLLELVSRGGGNPFADEGDGFTSDDADDAFRAEQEARTDDAQQAPAATNDPTSENAAAEGSGPDDDF